MYYTYNGKLEKTLEGYMLIRDDGHLVAEYDEDLDMIYCDFDDYRTLHDQLRHTTNTYSKRTGKSAFKDGRLTAEFKEWLNKNIQW